MTLTRDDALALIERMQAGTDFEPDAKTVLENEHGWSIALQRRDAPGQGFIGLGGYLVARDGRVWAHGTRQPRAAYFDGLVRFAARNTGRPSALSRLWRRLGAGLDTPELVRDPRPKG